MTFLSLSCSAELCPVTSRSWAPWGKALPAEASLVQLTGTSFRWSTRLPWGKTWRRLRSAGASTSPPTNPWRTAISSGKAFLEARCRCSTDPARLSLNNQREQQRPGWSPEEAGSRRRPTRRRTSHVHPRDARWTRRAWRKRQRKERTRGWRGSRRTLQVQTEEVRHVHIPAATPELTSALSCQISTRLRGEWCGCPANPASDFSWRLIPKRWYPERTTGAAKLSGLLRCARTLHTHACEPATQQKGLQPHVFTLS